ncbi:MAG: hypothetical protein ACKPKO_26510, partial [Candidatus Fonsibacter sp.]
MQPPQLNFQAHVSPPAPLDKGERIVSKSRAVARASQAEIRATNLINTKKGRSCVWFWGGGLRRLTTPRTC